MTEMGSGKPETCHNILAVSSKKRWTHVRLNIYPDGGVARLKVYGVALPDWKNISSEEVCNLRQNICFTLQAWQINILLNVCF